MPLGGNSQVIMQNRGGSVKSPAAEPEKRFLAEFILSAAEGLELTAMKRCHPERT